MDNNPPTQPPKNNRRKRGAQPGNLNALKHGFYKTPRPPIIDDLAGELAMIRERLEKLYEDTRQISDPDTAASVLIAIARAGMAIASILKTQQFLSGKIDPLEAATRASLVALMDQWNLDQEVKPYDG